jgi:hypothetical protein
MHSYPTFQLIRVNWEYESRGSPSRVIVGLFNDMPE